MVYGARWRKARLIRALAGLHASAAAPDAAFIVGCGRSGTTFLGDSLSRHPECGYHFEPYHLWCALAPETDANHLYQTDAGRLLMDERDASPEMEPVFRALFLNGAKRKSRVVVEKTPHNAMRIGFLRRLAPNARFVHIVRSGFHVARSIERLASTNHYQIAFRDDYNQWWGRGGAKWHHLSRDGADADYFKDEVGQLLRDDAKGAYEWLVSLAEVDRWRETLGPRLLEITYEELVAEPRATLGIVARFLGLSRDEAWLDGAAERVRPPTHHLPTPLMLPLRMRTAFNRTQRRYGFAEYAIDPLDLAA